jgi:putative inorganic carbon (hco3(-)) transporter
MLGFVPTTLAFPFVGVLLWSWISFMNPHRVAWGWASNTPWAAIVFTATLAGCVIAREPRRFALNATTAMVLVFMACISLTSLAALAPADLVEAKWSTVMKSFLFLLIAASLLTNKVRIHALVWIMVISIGFFGVRGGAFALLTGGAYRVYGPPDTMIEDNNHLAAAILVTLPLANYLRLQSQHKVVRIGLAIAMGLMLLAIVASYSRGALLGLITVALFLWWNSSAKILPAIALIIALTGALSFMPQSWFDRMSTIQSYSQDESAETRLTMWTTSLTMALDRPLTGSGFMGPYTQSVVDEFVPGAPARAVHSIYFEVIGEHGLPTFLVWLSLSVIGYVNANRVRRLTKNVPNLTWCNDLARMAHVSITGFLVSGTFLSLCYWDFYFMVLIVLAATRAYVATALEARPGARRGSHVRVPLLAETAR